MGELDNYLKEVGEREERATPGPWRGFAGVIRTKHGSHGCNDPDVHKHGTDDSLFIAHSRQDIPKLLEIVKVLAKAISDECFCIKDFTCDLCESLTKAGEIAKK